MKTKAQNTVIILFFIAMIIIIIGITTKTVFGIVGGIIIFIISMLIWIWYRILIKNKKTNTIEQKDVSEITEKEWEKENYYKAFKELPGNNRTIVFTTDLIDITIPTKGKYYIYTCYIHNIMDREKIFDKEKGRLLIEMHIIQNSDKRSMERYVEEIPIKTNFFEKIWKEEHKNFYPYSIRIYQKSPGL